MYIVSWIFFNKVILHHMSHTFYFVWYVFFFIHITLLTTWTRSKAERSTYRDPLLLNMLMIYMWTFQRCRLHVRRGFVWAIYSVWHMWSTQTRHERTSTNIPAEAQQPCTLFVEETWDKSAGLCTPLLIYRAADRQAGRLVTAGESSHW